METLKARAKRLWDMFKLTLEKWGSLQSYQQNRCWICKVIGWHIHCLHRGNRALCCRSDTFLKFAHLFGQSWLISYGAWHATKKR